MRATASSLLSRPGRWCARYTLSAEDLFPRTHLRVCTRPEPLGRSPANLRIVSGERMSRGPYPCCGAEGCRADLGNLRAYRPRNGHILRDRRAVRSAHGERIQATLPKLPWLVATRDGQVLGCAYASQHRERAAYRWSVDATAYVAEAKRRTGVGTRLYRTLIAVLRLQGFRSAFAGIALPNPASVALHEAMGFKHLGVYADIGFKLGRWHSVGWSQLGLARGDKTPVEPTPFADIRGSRALSAILE
jgi:L-amino acid N-acyltransferase YncA